MDISRINWRRLVPVVLLIFGIFLLSTPTTLKTTTWISSSSDSVQDAISLVELRSSTDYERIVNTAEYINDRTDYKLQGDACLSQKPDDVLELGEGDCVSFSKLATAMLTGMDIPVQIVEGCVFSNRQTSLDNSVPPKDFAIPIDYSVKNTFGTESRAIGPSSGQLHNWIRAYDGERWWTVETTAGVVFLVIYEESYGYNKFGGFVNAADPWDLCLLIDDKYVDYCREG